MITISVESDEEQWAIGTALVNGVIGFGNWPYEIKRRYRAGGDGSAGVSGAAVTAGSAGGGGSGHTVSSGHSGGNGLTVGCGAAPWPDYFVCPLRTCCATLPSARHLDGCDEAG